MSLEFYRQLAQRLEQGAVVVATVTQTKGSVPREVGAKMIITHGDQGRDRTVDTIGGGAGEAKVIRQALQVLKTGEKQWVEIDLSGTPHRETQGVCGGWMQVWVERWQGERAIALVQDILKLLEAGQAGSLVTPFAADPSPYLTSPHGTSPLFQTTAFIEPLFPSPILLIVGAGHVGVALAQVAQFAGFQVVVQDDRPDFACASRFPVGTRLLRGAIASALQDFSPNSNFYVALVTRGYSYDLDALRALLPSSPPYQPRYIGMIGSIKRVRQVRQALAQEGLPPHLLQQLYAPIGLDIGALTPEEIAVSICAELIQVRRGGTGQPLSTGLRQMPHPPSFSSEAVAYVQPTAQQQ